MLQVLEDDFARIPALLGRSIEPPPVLASEPALEHPTQLGLF
jgi:hypothetical protein